MPCWPTAAAGAQCAACAPRSVHEACLRAADERVGISVGCCSGADARRRDLPSRRRQATTGSDASGARTRHGEVAALDDFCVCPRDAGKGGLFVFVPRKVKKTASICGWQAHTHTHTRARVRRYVCSAARAPAGRHPRKRRAARIRACDCDTLHFFLVPRLR